MTVSEEDRHLRLTGEFDCDATPLATLRHSTSHVMAQAVKRLFPEVKVAIGPAIEEGFYYDFFKAEPFTQEDLARIEDEMHSIAKADLRFERREMPRAGSTSSSSTRSRRERRSGCPLAGRSCASWSGSSARSSTQAATRRPPRRSSSTRSCGSSRATGTITRTTCSWWRPKNRYSVSNR